MRKLYENFKILHIQKRIVSLETIRGNTVGMFHNFSYEFVVSNGKHLTLLYQKQGFQTLIIYKP